MKFFNILAISVLTFVCFTGVSFSTMDVDSQEYHMDKIRDVFDQMAKDADVPVKVIRGDYFYPPEFWQRSIDVLIDELYPDLDKNSVPDMYAAKCGCFCSSIDPYPIEMEKSLEQDVCQRAEKFMKNQDLEFDQEKFFSSLKFGRENGDFSFWKSKRVPATPIITFFEPFFTIPIHAIDIFYKKK